METENATPRYTNHFYAHRPLYRPGETIHFKSIIRAGDDANCALPEQNRQVTIVVQDGQGNEVYRHALPLSKMGTVTDTLELADDTALSNYQIAGCHLSCLQPEHIIAEFVNFLQTVRNKQNCTSLSF